MAPKLCSAISLVFFFVVSAIPIGYLVYLETAKPATHVYHYHSGGCLRECAKWDDLDRRFLVSFLEGGVGQVSVPDDHSPADAVLEEVVVVRDLELAGNGTVGIFIDRRRNRLLAVYADVMWKRYSALAAYDLSTWTRLFLTQLGGPGGEKSFADDVAVDAEGNSYVTDCRANKIWKLGVNGELLSIIRSPLFTPNHWYKNLVGLNGIVYHPDGFLIVVHTFSGNLFKVDLKNGEEVKLIKVFGGPLMHGDGLELLGETKLVVTRNPSARLVESTDGWDTASVVSKFYGPSHRIGTAATVKDGRVYVSHMVGMGYPKKKHALVEAVFSSF